MIKVFIPTYKRLDSLKWVLYSLIKTKDITNNIKKVCYVVNNYPINDRKVHEIVNDIEKINSTNWIFVVISRDYIIPPVDNWYSAIKEYSDYGDVVFLTGDDDLFLPNSINDRVEAILQNNADLLLTKHFSGLTFLEDSSKILLSKCFKNQIMDCKVNKLTLEDDRWSSIFISNNTYHYSIKMEKAIERCFKWCNELDWLDYDIRTLMLPFFIPIALIIDEGLVISQNKVYVIRGSNLLERISSKWSVAGWNSGFLHLAALGILNNTELNSLKELKNDRQVCQEFSSQWYYTYFLDSRITKEMREKMFSKIGKPEMNYLEHLKALKFIARDYLIRRTKLSRIKYFFGGSERVDIRRFINSLETLK